MILTKYDKKNKIVRCKCGGQVMVDGKMRYRLPLGFGFHPGSNKFAVDFVQYNGWHGFCLDCNKEVLGYDSKRVVSKTPKSINDKIAALPAQA